VVGSVRKKRRSNILDIKSRLEIGPQLQLRATQRRLKTWWLRVVDDEPGSDEAVVGYLTSVIHINARH